MNEGVSEKMFISIIMKGLPKEYESFTTLVKFSKEDKGLEKLSGTFSILIKIMFKRKVRVYSTIKKENTSIVKRSET